MADVIQTTEIFFWDKGRDFRPEFVGKVRERHLKAGAEVEDTLPSDFIFI